MAIEIGTLTALRLSSGSTFIVACKTCDFRVEVFGANAQNSAMQHKMTHEDLGHTCVIQEITASQEIAQMLEEQR